MLTKIIEYEEQILKYRSELNNLIREYSTTDKDSNLIELKIKHLKQELAHMDAQLNALRATLNTSDIRLNTPVQQNTINVQPTATMNNTVSNNANVNANTTGGTYYGGSTARPVSNTTTHKNTPQKTKKDFENIMGKNLMGIFASVLIFISFIVFATIVLPKLSDVIKMIAMYFVSFAFLGLGLYLINKDIKNKFYLSISGCGIGAVYISILISNIYFNAIGDIFMYVLIFIWALFVCYLSRAKSYIFQIIGQAGITIAILFGSILCADTSDWTKLMYLIIFFIASQTMFFVAHYQEQYHDNIVNIIGMLVCMFILTITLPDYFDDGQILIITICRVLLTVFTLIQMGLVLFKFEISQKGRIPFVITNICYYIILSSLLDFETKALYILGITLLALISVEWKFFDKKFDELRVLQIFYMFTLITRMYSFNSVDSLEFIMDYASFAILIIPFAIYGFLAKEKIYKAASLVYLALFIFDFGMNDTAQILLGIVVLALYCYLLKAKQYNSGIKTYLYVMIMFFTLFTSFTIMDSFDISGEIYGFAVFVIVSLIHIIAVKTPFGKNWIDKSAEDSFGGISGVANAILMSFSLIFINILDEPVLHFLAILIALTLFMVNSVKLLERKGLGWGIYVGIKFTIYMLVILNSYTVPSFAVSICCLLFAIASIVVGFMFKYKSLRLYGLGLSILSIVKLILIDMNHENPISIAFSIFVCGMLCFAINLIYNYVDKRISNN